MDAPADRSIAAVVGDIVDNLQGIVRSEVRLARAEFRDDVARAKRGLALLATAAVIGGLALAFFMLAAVYGLSTVMAPWAAALIVAGGSAVVAGIAGAAGMKSFRDFGFPKTAATIQENVQWAKTRVK